MILKGVKKIQMKVTRKRPVRTSGALAGVNRGAGQGVGVPTSGRRVPIRSGEPRGPRPGNDRMPRHNQMRRDDRLRRNMNRQTPPPHHRPPHHHHHGERRRGNCISYFAALIVMLVIVFLVFFGDEIKAKVFNDDTATTNTEVELEFRNDSLLNDHYDKHGADMGFTSAQSYQEAAAKVVENSDSLHKKEAEDGDDVYYLESTNELVIVAKDGYIRTYFCPEDGIEYYNRQ